MSSRGRSAILGLTLAALAAGCGRCAPGGAAAPSPGSTSALERTQVLARDEEANAGPPGDAQPASPFGLHAPAQRVQREYLFAERGGGVAYRVDRGGTSLVSHNGREGRAYSAIGEIRLSPDGRRCAYAALSGQRWKVVVDGEEGARGFDAVEGLVFSQDGKHLAFAGMDGDRWYLVVDGVANAGTVRRYNRVEFGAGGQVVVLEEGAELDRSRLFVARTGEPESTEVTLADDLAYVRLSDGATAVAAVRAREGGVGVSLFRLDGRSAIDFPLVQDAVYTLFVGPDDASVTYVAQRGDRQTLVWNDRERELPGALVDRPVFAAGGKGILALVASSESVRLRRFFDDEGEIGAAYDEAEGLTVDPARGRAAFAARRGDRWFVVVDGHEGPPHDRVVSPAFCPNARCVVYRARQDGRRFAVVADLEGRTLRKHADHEQVFPLVFTADGRSVAYGVKDGAELVWWVEPL